MRSKPKENTSFYTSLLDLTFNMVGSLGATLLIFIIFLVIVMTALKESEEENSGKDTTIVRMGHTIGGLQTQIKKLSGRPLTLVVCIDVTNSMDDEIKALTAAIDAMCVFLPVSSTKFELSILAYRKGVVDRLELMEIKKDEADEGASRQIALAFVKSLAAKPSPTAHRSVAIEAHRTFGQADPKFAEDRREVWVWIGDVFTAELDEDVASYSDAEREEAKAIVSGTQKWVSQGGDRRVLAFFSEKPESQQTELDEESKKWFKALGQVNDKSVFETEISKLLVALKTAVLSEDE